MASNSSSRERGTLLTTLPKAWWIILLGHVVCTAFGTFLSQYSLHNIEYLDIGIGFKVALGVASSMVALLHTDAFLFLVSFTIPLLIAIDATSLSPEQLTISLAPIAIFLASRLSFFRKILSYGSSSIRSQKRFPLAAPLPLLLLIVTGTSRMIHHGIEAIFLFTPTVILGLAAFYVYFQYNTKRAHPNGNLNVETNSVSNLIVTLILIGTTLSIIAKGENTDIIVSMLPFLIGALTSTAGAASFACCADVWYAVGTGQFQMISVDTAGIGFYFVLPIVVLAVRFFDMYEIMVNQFVEFVAGHWARTFEDMFGGLARVEDDVVAVYTAFVAFILVTNGIGLSLVQSLCPLGGHLFGRVYTHGQPNTKLVAISVDYRDLYAPSIDEKERDTVFKMLSEWKVNIKSKYTIDTKVIKDGAPIKAALNINVTASDLKESPDDIKKLSKEGHEIAITIDDDLKFTSIDDAHDLSKQVLGVQGASSTWYHTGTSSKGASPRSHSKTSSLGMRSVMWSNYICTGQCKNTDAELLSLETDMDVHRGGSFIYLRSGSTDSSLLMTLKCILEMLERKEFVPTNFSSVAKEQNKMDLS